MFGFAAYAAIPYASVGGSRYAANIFEEAVGSDETAAFLENDARVFEQGQADDSYVAVVGLSGSVAESTRAFSRVSATGFLNADFSDGAIVGDNVDGPRGFFRIFSDIGQAEDRFGAQGDLRSTTTDTALATDALSAAHGAGVAVAERATATDTTRSVPTYSTQVLEAASAALTFAASVRFFADVADAAEGAVTVPTNADLNIGVFDGSFAIDRPFTNVHVFSSVVDAATGVDLGFIGRFLWELIDDTQPLSWQNVVSLQTPGWVVVNTAQGVVWQHVSTTQTPGWGQIDTEQEVVWQTINNI